MPPCGDVPLSAFGSVDKLCLDAVRLLFAAAVPCDRRGDRLTALDEQCRACRELCCALCLCGGEEKPYSEHEHYGGQYDHYEHPEQTEFWAPPLTLGTTPYFFEEIRDMKKKADRFDVMDELLADDSLWVRIR